MTKKHEPTPSMIGISFTPSMREIFDTSILQEAAMILGPLKMLDPMGLELVHQKITDLLQKNIALVNNKTKQENDPLYMSLLLQWFFLFEIIKAENSKALPNIGFIEERWYLLDTYLRNDN